MNLMSWIYPEKCPFCGKMLSGYEYAHIGCCAKCASSSYIRTQGIQTCPYILSYVLNIYCPLIYAGPVKEAIVRYKFRGENWMYKYFARILHTHLVSNQGYQHCDYITSVPISNRRFRLRGYNQASILAKEIAKLSGIPFREFLVREEQNGDVQTGKMNRKNRLAINRFRLNSSVKIPENAGILLIDDILTTGSTIDECSRILLGSGAGFVKVAVLASGRRDLGGICA